MTTVTCPRCQRKLRLPMGVAGQAVRCPACEAIFEATAEAAPEVQRSGTEPGERFSDQPVPSTPAPKAAPDPDQAETAWSSDFRGNWVVVRRGLGWMLAAQCIELVLHTLGMLLAALLFARTLARGPGLDGLTAWWFDWEAPGICARMLALFVAGLCMLVGLVQCQRCPASGPARRTVTAAFIAFMIAYLIRVACPVGRLPYLFVMSPFWELGGFLLLLPLWVAEALLIRFLHLLACDWRDEPILAVLRWLLALLAADVVLHLGEVTGMIEKWREVVVRHSFIDMFSLDLLFWLSHQSLRLVMTALLLRVLLGLRAVLAQPGGAREPE
jgi:hypothetical protein